MSFATKSTAAPRQAAAFRTARPAPRTARHARHVCMAKTTLEFIRGVEEPNIPEVRLTRSRDGASGTATFIFQNPTVFDASSELGDITGLYMSDAEGTLTTVNVQAMFKNGKPDKIEATYIMRSSFEWDRFMRFMERFAEDKGMAFSKST